MSAALRRLDTVPSTDVHVCPRQVLALPDFAPALADLPLCSSCTATGVLGDDLIACIDCGLLFHRFCFESPVNVSGDMLRTWRCDSCKVCEACQSTAHEAMLLVCDVCERAYHTFCLNPKLEAVPSGRWGCPDCAPKCANCPGRVALGSPAGACCVRCRGRLAAGCYCHLCNQTYAQDDFSLLMLICDTCERWVHAACDRVPSDVYHAVFASDESVEYVCPTCRPADVQPWWIAPGRGNQPGCALAPASSGEDDELDDGETGAVSVNQARADAGAHAEQPSRSKRRRLNDGTDAAPPALESSGASESTLSPNGHSPPGGVRRALTASSGSISASPSAAATAAAQCNLPSRARLWHTHVRVLDGPPTGDWYARIAEMSATHAGALGDLVWPAPEWEWRACALCRGLGDGHPLWLGRLLHCASDLWVHAACALWSVAVEEGDDGVLGRLMPLVLKRTPKDCAHCHEPGATVGCFSRSCHDAFHLPCAAAAGCDLLSAPTEEGCQRQMYCPRHRKTSADRPLPPNLTLLTAATALRREFSTLRRLAVDLRPREAAKFTFDSSEVLVPYRSDALCVHSLGVVQTSDPNWHDRRTIFPLGFCTSRLFWSVDSPTVLARYVCDIVSSADVPPSAEPPASTSAGAAAGAHAPAALLASPSGSASPFRRNAQAGVDLGAARPLFRIRMLTDARARFGATGAAAGAAAGAAGLLVAASVTGAMRTLIVAETAQEAWETVQRAVNALRDEANGRLQATAPSESGAAVAGAGAASKPVMRYGKTLSQIAGDALFGFREACTKQMIEALPGAWMCDAYAFAYFARAPGWDPDEYRVLPENPFGSARCQPYNRRRIAATLGLRAGGVSGGGAGAAAGGADEGSTKDAGLSNTGSELPLAMQYRQLLLHPPKLRIGKSPIQGQGLFTDEAVPARTLLIEYQGEMIRTPVANLRERRYDRAGLGTYMFKIDDENIVDATMKGNKARFINHSCTPNCSTRIANVEGERKIIIVAATAIAAGTELTYDYKFELETDPLRKVPCGCQSPMCRGWMN